jgi:hypothetical protein
MKPENRIRSTGCQLADKLVSEYLSSHLAYSFDYRQQFLWRLLKQRLSFSEERDCSTAKLRVARGSSEVMQKRAIDARRSAK